MKNRKLLILLILTLILLSAAGLYYYFWGGSEIKDASVSADDVVPGNVTGSILTIDDGVTEVSSGSKLTFTITLNYRAWMQSEIGSSPSDQQIADWVSAKSRKSYKIRAFLASGKKLSGEWLLAEPNFDVTIYTPTANLGQVTYVASAQVPSVELENNLVISTVLLQEAKWSGYFRFFSSGTRGEYDYRTLFSASDSDIRLTSGNNQNNNNPNDLISGNNQNNPNARSNRCDLRLNYLHVDKNFVPFLNQRANLRLNFEIGYENLAWGASGTAKGTKLSIYLEENYFTRPMFDLSSTPEISTVSKDNHNYTKYTFSLGNLTGTPFGSPSFNKIIKFSAVPQLPNSGNNLSSSYSYSPRVLAELEASNDPNSNNNSKFLDLRYVDLRNRN